MGRRFVHWHASPADSSPGPDLKNPFGIAGGNGAGGAVGTVGRRRTRTSDAGPVEKAERYGAALAGWCLDACGGLGLADRDVDVDVDVGGDADSELLGLWGPEMQSAADALAPWPL